MASGAPSLGNSAGIVFIDENSGGAGLRLLDRRHRKLAQFARIRVAPPAPADSRGYSLSRDPARLRANGDEISPLVDGRRCGTQA